MRKTLAELIILGRPLVLDVLRVKLAAQRLVDVDVLLQGERGIEHGFHALQTVSLYRLLDLTRVVGRVLDDVLTHLLLAARKRRLLREKSACPSTWAVTRMFSARPLLAAR